VKLVVQVVASVLRPQLVIVLRGCNQKFPDWPSGARTANDKLSAPRCSCIAILWVILVSFFRHNPLCCFSTSVCCCLCRYRLSPETFGYVFVYQFVSLQLTDYR